MLRRDCRLSSLLPDWGEGSESIDFFLRRFKGEKKGMKIHLRNKPGPIPRHEMKLCFLKLHSLKLKEDKFNKSWIQPSLCHHRISL